MYWFEHPGDRSPHKEQISPFLWHPMTFRLTNLTLNLLLTTLVPYSNNLNPDETPRNSASYPDPSFLPVLFLKHFHLLNILGIKKNYILL